MKKRINYSWPAELSDFKQDEEKKNFSRDENSLNKFANLFNLAKG
jgi:hypothetical protein